MDKLTKDSEERAEEEAIQRGIDADPDTWDMSDEDWSRAWHGDPMKILEHLESIVIVDEEVAAHFAAQGGNWRKAINDALRKLIDAA